MERRPSFIGTVLALAAALIVASSASAQAAPGPVTITLTEHEQLGQILTTDDGRTIYLFVNETAEVLEGELMTEGVRSNAAACVGPCLDNWPPVLATDVTAGEGLDPDMLYLADVDGRMQVVYNGWPLYFFARDAAPGDVNGQGLGGDGNMWYVVSAEGLAVTDEPN